MTVCKGAAADNQLPNTFSSPMSALHISYPLQNVENFFDRTAYPLFFCMASAYVGNKTKYNALYFVL